MNSINYKFTDLDNKYVLWHHKVNDKNWDINSYKQVIKINTIEDYWIYIDSLEDKFINNTMFFLMKTGILPTWEDAENIKGGCISIKLPLKESIYLWRIACKYIVSNKLNENDNITGISISPKNSFNIIKIWFNKEINMDTYQFPDEFKLKDIYILFKLHKINIEKDKIKN